MPQTRGIYNSRHSRRKNKYGVSAEELRTYNGITFDSKAEMLRYTHLLLLQKAGAIQNLELQPHFELIPAFQRRKHKYRAMCYTADFRYQEFGNTIVEDVKGVKTKDYEMRKKAFIYLYPDIVFREVHNSEIKDY